MAIAACVALLEFVIVPAWQGHFPGALEDLRDYLAAARSVTTGGNAYATFLNTPQSVVGNGFIYPPAAVLPFLALAQIPFVTAAAMWVTLSVAAMLVGCLVLSRAVLPAHWPRTAIAIGVATFWGPTGSSLWSGQLNPVIFLLLATALHTHIARRERTAGALVGVATALKGAPAVILLVFLFTRQWRSLIAGVATIALAELIGCFAVGWSTTGDFLRHVLPALGTDTGWPYNFSLGGTVSRVFGHGVLQVSPEPWWMHSLALVLDVGAVGALAWTATRHRRRGPAEDAVVFSLGIIVMLAATSRSWYAQFVHLLIPLSCLAGLAYRVPSIRKDAIRLMLSIALVFIAIIPAVTATITVTGIRDVEPQWWGWFALQLASIPLLLSIGLGLLLVRGSNRMRDQALTTAHGE